MNRQLLAFSRNEFGNAFNVETHRWWKIEHLSNVGDLSIDIEGHPADVPAYRLEDGNFDVASLTVVVIGSNQTFGLAIDIVEELRKRKVAASFMAGVASLVRYYGLFPFKKVDFQQGEALNSRVRSLSTDSNPFDSVFIQGDCNRVDNNGENYSYAKLVDKDGKRHDIDLTVQIVYHLALTQGTLSHVDGNPFNVVGAYSLNYEPSKEKERVARGLTKAIASKFLTDELGENWHKESTATLSDSFESDLGWKSIYGKLKGGYDSLPTDELCPKSPISPWALFSKYLIPKYFKKYIRGLLRQLRSNVDGFSFLTIEKYKNHLDNQYESLICDSEQKKRIEEELSTIWDKDNKGNRAIGMKQFLSRLKKMKDFFVLQKTTIERLRNRSTADGKNTDFPNLTDYPLGNFGEYDKAYRKFANSMGPEGMKEDSNDSTGNGILNKIKRILSFHPVPLSLLVRSVLLGVLLPTVLLTIIKGLNTIGVIDTPWLVTQSGSIVLVASCFLICVLWAVLKYHFGIVDGIKVKIKEYVGWRLYRLQMSAYDSTLEREIDYYKNAISICDKITDRIDSVFGVSEVKFDSELAELFDENKFQTDVLGDCEGQRVLTANQVNASVTVSVNEFGRDIVGREAIDSTGSEERDKIHYGVLRNALMINTNNGLLNRLKSILFSDVEEDAATEFWNELLKYIKEDVAFDIAGRPINTLSDLVLDNNLNEWMVGIRRYSVCGVIGERSYPSADVLDAAFYFASIVVPDRHPEDSSHWRRILRMEDETGMYDTRKGAYELSVLQGLSITNIGMVNDFNL
jgi:hypothetical protein